MNKHLAFIVAVLALAVTGHAEVGDFQITFKVVDESGKPMPGVNVGTSFIQTKSSVTLTAYDLSKNQINVLTDKDGRVIVKGSSVYDRHIYSGIKPVAGYYAAGSKDYIFQDVEKGRWRPWNPTIQFILKPIGVQVPMYAKKIWGLAIPEINKPVGYDLMLGDWVAPYGTGLNADFIMTVARQFTSVTQAFNATLTLTFSCDGDGIQSILSDNSGSSFRIPRSAPVGNYESKLVLHMYREENKPMVGVLPKEDQNYFFRVRTKKDGNGNIVSAMYGKIYGDIGWDIFHSPTAELGFTYYLNPELNSRNMEFAPRKNLFTKLPLLERVSAP